MKDKIQAFALRRWDDFRRFTPGQKAVTIAALAAVLIGGYVLATWSPSPSYAPLYSNLAASDASAIVSKLSGQHIPYKLQDGGTEILVPQDKVDAARLQMSSAGLPGSEHTGYSLLDKEGVTTSQFKQQIDYQRAVEGELAKTIESIDRVTAASVHLSIPQQDVFNDGTQKTSAAVLLSVDPGTTLDDSQVQSVSNLVSSSVPGLKAGDVAISDSNGTVLKAPGTGMDGAVSADTQAKATQAYDAQLSQKVQGLLDKSLGPNHAVVTVNAALDFNQTKSTKRTYVYDPKTPPVSESKTSKVYKGAGAGAGGTLGATSGTDTTSGASNNGSLTENGDTVNNALGTDTTTTQNSPGQLQKLSVAVMLDQSAKNLNVAGMEALIKSGIGFNQTRGDSLSVRAVPFDTSAADAAKKAGAAATKAHAAQAAHDRLMSLVKQGVLVLLIAGLIIGAILFARRRNPPAARRDDDVLDFDDHDDDVTEAAPPAPRPVDPHAASAAQRRDLVNMAGDRPQDVARVLSGWLNTPKETDR